VLEGTEQGHAAGDAAQQTASADAQATEGKAGGRKPDLPAHHHDRSGDGCS
jgi:hypothetical protein